ncbi:MAG TPA: CoA ester lyase [Anaerovoracaceae bacterium]|nr:CoA ester lyase [Anaerovoracaceae bacterium]
MSRRFIRRSLLYVPGSSGKMLSKSVDLNADSIIADLEDAVSMTEKDAARETISEFIPRIQAAGKEAVVRVNAMNTFFGVKDLIAVAEMKPNAVIVPKADVLSVKMADNILSGLEEHLELSKGSIHIIPLLETAAGIMDAVNIVGASPRINGVQLGAEDLTKELGIKRTAAGDEIAFARQRLVYAACAYNVDCFDTPFTGIKDMEGLGEDACSAAAMGFTGKTCIHPAHIDAINRVFSVSGEEINHARRLVEAFEIAVSRGKGACMFEGKMIDAPIAERARKLLSKAAE